MSNAIGPPYQKIPNCYDLACNCLNVPYLPIMQINNWNGQLLKDLSNQESQQYVVKQVPSWNVARALECILLDYCCTLNIYCNQQLDLGWNEVSGCRDLSGQHMIPNSISGSFMPLEIPSNGYICRKVGVPPCQLECITE